MTNISDTKQGYNFLYVNIPLIVTATALVGFRVWWRCVKNGSLNRADICVVFCLLLNIIQVSFISAAIVNWGFGHHAAYLSLEQRRMSLLYFFIFQNLVKNTVGLTKVSLLLLYLDIFPQRKFRLICWALMAQIILGLIAMSFTTIFQCYPVSFSYDKTIHGKCIDIKAFWYGQSGWNTVMDVVVLVLPIPVIMKLQMNRRSKLALLAVFTLGTFVCVTSIMRMISLNFNKTFAKDMTWATGTSVLWTQVESTIGVICACAPSVRIPLARFFPYLFGSTRSEPAYPLSDGPVSRVVGQKNTTWKERDEFEEIDANYKSEGSQERIMGIKKTISIDMTSLEETDKDKQSKTPYARHQVLQTNQTDP